MKKTVLFMGALAALSFNSKSQNVVYKQAMYGDCQMERIGLCIDNNDNAYLMGSFNRASYNRVLVGNRSIGIGTESHRFVMAQFNSSGSYVKNHSEASINFGQLLDMGYNASANRLYALGGNREFSSKQKGVYVNFNMSLGDRKYQSFTKSSDYVFSNSVVNSSGTVYAFGSIYGSKRITAIRLIGAGKSTEVQISSTNGMYLDKPAFDSNEDIWVGGHYTGSFGSFPDSTNNFKGIIMKLKSNGSQDTSFTLTGGSDIRISGLDVYNDKIICAGMFKGSVSIGGQSLAGSQTQFNGFVLSMNPDGTVNWLNKIASPYTVSPRRLAVNNCGKIAVTGYYTNDMSYDGQSVVNTANTNATAFVLLINENGEIDWLKTATADANSSSRGVRVAFKNNGPLVVAGNFNRQMIFDNDSLNGRTGSAASSTANVFMYEFAVNQGPTSLALSNSSLEEEQAAKTFVGTLSSVDCAGSTIFNYALVAGSGDTDNGLFEVSNDSLYATSKFDFETTTQANIRVRVSSVGNDYEKAMVINITDVEEPSAIDDLGNPSKVTIYPNPTHHSLNLSGDSFIESVQMHSINGELKFQSTYSETQEVSIDVSELESGVYFLNVFSSGHSGIYRVVKL